MKKQNSEWSALVISFSIIHLIIYLVFLKTGFNGYLSSMATQALEEYQQSTQMECYTNHRNVKDFGSNLNKLSLPWILLYFSPH